MSTRALEAGEAALGPDDRWVGTLADRLAVLYAEEGHAADAEPLFKRAIAIYEKNLGPYHPTFAAALYKLAIDYEIQWRFDEAEALLRRALDIRLSAYGPNHPAVEKAREALSRVQNIVRQIAQKRDQMIERVSAPEIAQAR